MATARKPFVRIATSIIREPWAPDIKYALVMLTCMMGDRWARDRLTPDEACKITLSSAQLYEITGKRRRDVARTLIERLANVTSMLVEHRADFTSINWPKFAIYQELGSSRRGNTRRRQTFGSPRTAPAPAPAPKNRSRTSNGAASDDASPRGNGAKNLVLFDADPVVVADEIVVADQLVNLLAPYGDDPAAKRAWLELELPLLICEVQALPDITDTRQAMAKLRALMIRYWRQELRNPGRRNGRPAPESFDEAHIREGREWLNSL